MLAQESVSIGCSEIVYEDMIKIYSNHGMLCTIDIWHVQKTEQKL